MSTSKEWHLERTPSEVHGGQGSRGMDRCFAKFNLCVARVLVMPEDSCNDDSSSPVKDVVLLPCV